MDAQGRKMKKIWKNLNTTDEWKLENLNILKKRMKESQLKTFEKSYNEKIEFGKLVFSKDLKKNHKTQTNQTLI